MNVYDEAHSLAKAISESNEYKEFDTVRKEVEKDEEISKMLGEMQQIQMELQTAQMQGKEPDQEVLSRAQSLSAMMATKPLAAKFIQVNTAFSVMMNDVFAIIGDAVSVK